jgi:FkbM family methyltransferase
MAINGGGSEIYDERARQWRNYDGVPVEMETGAKLILNPKCEYSRKRFIYRKSEVPEVCIMQNIVKEGDCVLDIGANIGYWTTVLSSQVGRGGRVFAFEPNPKTFDLLTKNININDCKNVIARNVGIAEANRSGKLYIDELHSGDDRVYCPTLGMEMNDRSVMDISLRTLDSFKLEIDLQRLSFIKIDVQGFEPMVLKGAYNVLESSNPVLLIEFSSSCYAEAGSSMEEFFKIYSELSFKCYIIPTKEKINDQNIIFEEIDLFKLDYSFSGNIILKRG